MKLCLGKRPLFRHSPRRIFVTSIKARDLQRHPCFRRDTITLEFSLYKVEIVTRNASHLRETQPRQRCKFFNTNQPKMPQTVHQRVIFVSLRFEITPSPNLGLILQLLPRRISAFRSGAVSISKADCNERPKKNASPLLCDDQACKLKFKLRELISCFCCVQTSHAAPEADSRGNSGT